MTALACRFMPSGWSAGRKLLNQLELQLEELEASAAEDEPQV
jgi:hypothetical protein